jgi:hypothetical protein
MVNAVDTALAEHTSHQPYLTPSAARPRLRRGTTFDYNSFRKSKFDHGFPLQVFHQIEQHLGALGTFTPRYALSRGTQWGCDFTHPASGKAGAGSAEEKMSVDATHKWCSAQCINHGQYCISQPNNGIVSYVPGRYVLAENLREVSGKRRAEGRQPRVLACADRLAAPCRNALLTATYPLVAVPVANTAATRDRPDPHCRCA